MRLLIQRVKSAKVVVNEKITGQIDKGLLLFLGVHKNDTTANTKWFVNKVLSLRIFPDDNGKMNRDVLEAKGDILVVSQFTLYADCMSGRRPDFDEAALPEPAFLLYEQFTSELAETLDKPIQRGVFGAIMEVFLINDGPVTFLLEK